MKEVLLFKNLRKRIKIHPTLIALLLLFWAVARIYIPIVSPNFTTEESWLLAVLIALLSAISLILHLYAHRGMALFLKEKNVSVFTLSFLGDLAQERSWAPSEGKEFLISISGPILNGILALISYSIWNGQFDPVLNTVFSFLALFNLFLGALNLAPFCPFDGGFWSLFLVPRL